MSNFKGIILILVIALTSLFAIGCTMSPYDVAVKNGFGGTEQQWLTSLQGKDGSDGADLTIDGIYEKAKESGFSGSYLDFLREYLTFELPSDNSAAISVALKSALMIRCDFAKNTSNAFDKGSYAQAGAGVIYKLNKSTSSAYIITNFHVVYSANSKTPDKISDSITVTPYGGQAIKATYIGGSADYDIAVLKAENEYFSSEIAKAVTVADSDDISVGQTVIAIGNPAGNGISATQGIISVDSEYITMNAIDNSSKQVTMRVLRIDAAVNSGNSGGGLFDANGSLVGIVNAKSADNSIENMGYAIPSSVATAVADNIIKNSYFNRGTVGITVKSQDSQAYIDDDGYIKIKESVVITAVQGAATGKLEVNDIILSINLDHEKAVTRQFHVTDELLKSTPGDTVTFKVLRGGKEVSVQVVCG